MPSMIDAACSRCGKRFGWSGNAGNRPPCPRCGHRPPQEELDAADAEIKRFEELLASQPNANVCRQQRVAAGLTLRKAAELIGVMPSVLSLMEQGRMPIDDPVQGKMAEVYGVGGDS